MRFGLETRWLQEVAPGNVERVRGMHEADTVDFNCTGYRISSLQCEFDAEYCYE